MLLSPHLHNHELLSPFFLTNSSLELDSPSTPLRSARQGRADKRGKSRDARSSGFLGGRMSTCAPDIVRGGSGQGSCGRWFLVKGQILRKRGKVAPLAADENARGCRFEPPTWQCCCAELMRWFSGGRLEALWGLVITKAFGVSSFLRVRTLSPMLPMFYN
ncbi:hypothetical protein RRG08_014617 [Elysia crispata]|uniref:Uncharacterized protein n=1 Tax=Elysia crispata TaxID=231223 RepID=A0AAE1D3E8_9GAST|nr:hypothetical protein RRG08_014617 [Elysia crispata]